MKKILNYSLLLSLVFTIYSCTNSEDNTENSTINKTSFATSKGIINNNSVKSIRIDNRTYVTKDNNTVSKYEENIYKYDITTPNSNIGTADTAVDFSRNFTITNGITNEKINVINIREQADSFIFDAITSTGERVNNLQIYTESNVQRHPIVRGLVTVLIAVIDSFQPSPLQQCQTAMSSLNCSGNSNAYMNFQDGWFSTSCSVGCR